MLVTTNHIKHINIEQSQIIFKVIPTALAPNIDGIIGDTITFLFAKDNGIGGGLFGTAVKAAGGINAIPICF